MTEDDQLVSFKPTGVVEIAAVAPPRSSNKALSREIEEFSIFNFPQNLQRGNGC